MDNILIKKISKVKFISLDIFDTAILRIVNDHSQLFKLVEDEYNSENKKLNFDFYRERISAEECARSNKNKDSEEITLDEIYNYLAYLCNDSNLANKLKDIEVNLEEKLAVANNEITEVYNYCIENNKKIIFISDMYLSKKTLEIILNQNGYRIYSKLYISSEVMKTKISGNLYKHVIDDLKCNPNDLLHIGVDINSDYKVPSKLGILTYHYKSKIFEIIRNHERLNMNNIDSEMTHSIYSVLVHNNKHANKLFENFWYRLGYDVFGILAIGFCLWLKEEIKKNDDEIIYFLARDAYIFEKIFKIITEKYKYKISSRYLLMSRRAVIFASFEKELTDKNLEYLTSKYDTLGVSLKTVFERIGLSIDEFANEIYQAGFSSGENIILNANDLSNLKKLLNFKDIKRSILDKSIKERESFIQYLNQNDFFKYNNIGIIDIGWHGNVQKALEDMIRINTDICNKSIHGYYFATFNQVVEKIREGYLMEGYIANAGVPFNRSSVISQNLILLESVFTAPYGSLRSFRMENEEVFPVFEKFELDQIERESINKIQDGIIDFVTDYLNTIQDKIHFNIDKDYSVSLLKRLYESPSLEEASRIGDLTHFDSWKIYNLAKPLKFHEYFIHPVLGYRHFKSCRWRQAYTCRMFGKCIFYKPSIRLVRYIKAILKKILKLLCLMYY